MACNRCNYFSFWAIPYRPKNQNEKKNEKRHLEISSFYNSVPKTMIICHTVVPEIWCVTDVIIFNFGPFFALLPP